MELHKRMELIDTLLEEAEQKRTALTHALNARERVEQGEESTHFHIIKSGRCVIARERANGEPLKRKCEGGTAMHPRLKPVAFSAASCRRGYGRQRRRGRSARR